MTPCPEPQWIWSQTPEDHHVWTWARRRFDLPALLREATLEICADLRYLLWVNGERVGFGPPKFHAPTPTIDRYDISPFLREKDNVIAVRVYSLGKAAISSVMPQRGALWARLNAGEASLVSDHSWKVQRDGGYLANTASRGSCQPPCEIYDARSGLGDPSLPDYDDTQWPPASELPPLSGAAFEARDIPFMTSETHLADRAIEWGLLRFDLPVQDLPFDRVGLASMQAALLPDRAGKIAFHEGAQTVLDATGLASHEALYALFDLGRVWTGYPVLTVEGTPGTTIDLLYSENLAAHRTLPSKNPHIPYFDRIILGPSGIAHRITWPKCARYIQINVSGGRASVQELAFERSTYPVRWRGFFASDCPVLNQAWEISTHTVQLNMEDSYMDTPWRERGSWLGDDLIKCRAAYAVFGDYALARRFLLHLSRGQREDGTLASKYPANATSHLTTWTLCYPLSVLEYCRSSGDWAFASQMLPSIKKVEGWLAGRLREGGIYEAPQPSLTHTVGTYNFIDWAPVDMRGANTAWNAFAYESLRCMAALAQGAGDTAFAEATLAKAAALKTAFCELFWDSERNIFVNGRFASGLLPRWGCHENLLALLFGIATPEQRQQIEARLERENLEEVFIVNEDDYDVVLPECGKIPTVALALSCYRWPDEQMVPIGTPYFADYLLRVLIESGRADAAQRFIRKQWGEFSRQGATSVWEVWDMTQSLSHGWACAPVTLASHYFLGVHQAPGSHFRILPVSGSLRSARGRVMTRHGIVQVEWSQAPDWVLEVDLPPGAEFEVGLPTQAGCHLEVDGEPVATHATLQHCASPYQTFRFEGGGRHRLRNARHAS